VLAFFSRQHAFTLGTARAVRLSYRRCTKPGMILAGAGLSRLVATTVEEDRLEHLTTHSVAGIGEPPALACSQGLPGPSPEDLMGWPWA
jgi:hypothetical protein